MATVIGDFASDPSRFCHNMVFQPQQQQQPLRSSSRSRDSLSRQPPSSASPTASTTSRHLHHSHHARFPRTTPTREQPTQDWAGAKSAAAAAPARPHEDGASRFPTPPDSSSPSASNSTGARPQNAAANPSSSYMDASEANGVAHPQPTFKHLSLAPAFPASSAIAPSSAGNALPPSASSPSTSSATSHPTGAHSIPSPASDGFPQWAAPDSPTPRPHHAEARPQQTTIRVRDLAHIQSLARADLVTGNGPGILNDPPLSQMKYEISEMPIGDIIEMVAALLTKITTTNDLQHDALNRNAAHQRQVQQAQQQSDAGGEGNSSGGGGAGGGASPYANSVLAFHGKNVPAITILSYLSRIHKYCPTTFEVFLSLLVYFDRMTERVNELVVKSEQGKLAQAQARDGQDQRGDKQQHEDEDVVMSSDDDDEDAGAAAAASASGHDGDETDEDLADSSSEGEGDGDSMVEGKEQQQQQQQARGAGRSAETRDGQGAAAASSSLVSSTATYFVVDSYNIHRLIIAGVTCASKFFSDVFYTNSRYAKVGGLPLAELNHLELQFLLLNDFRLAVPVEDLEAYATMLVEFYAREVVAQRSRPATGPVE